MQSIKKFICIMLVFVLFFTTLPSPFSTNMTTVQAYTEEGMKDLQAVQEDGMQLDLLAGKEGWQNATGVTADAITLPILGDKGSNISWTSSDADLIDTKGKITIPSFSTFHSYYYGLPKVLLTAHISKAAEEAIKTYEINITSCLDETSEDVLANEDYNFVYNWADSERLSDSQGYDEASLNIPKTAPNGSLISWYSDNLEVIAADGTINRPNLDEGDKDILVTFVISRGAT